MWVNKCLNSRTFLSRMFLLKMAFRTIDPKKAAAHTKWGVWPVLFGVICGLFLVNLVQLWIVAVVSGDWQYRQIFTDLLSWHLCTLYLQNHNIRFQRNPREGKDYS